MAGTAGRGQPDKVACGQCSVLIEAPKAGQKPSIGALCLANDSCNGQPLLVAEKVDNAVGSRNKKPWLCGMESAVVGSFAILEASENLNWHYQRVGHQVLKVAHMPSVYCQNKCKPAHAWSVHHATQTLQTQPTGNQGGYAPHPGQLPLTANNRCMAHLWVVRCCRTFWMPLQSGGLQP